MNRIFMILAILSLAACKQATSPSVKKIANVTEINAFVDDWHKNATDANGKAYFDKIAPDGVFIGTDAGEHWKKQAFADFAMPYFDKGKAWSFTATGRNVFYSADSSVIWFDELLDTWMGPCRSSGVIETVNDSLKIAHYQLSVTVPNEKMDAFLQAVHEKTKE